MRMVIRSWWVELNGIPKARCRRFTIRLMVLFQRSVMFISLTFCPMDAGARIIRKATPRFAKIVSHKFAHGAATQVLEDLEQNHGRPCLKATLQDLATHVGTVVQTKEESWSYATPELGKVATVGIGVDGTCMLICDQ